MHAALVAAVGGGMVAGGDLPAIPLLLPSPLAPPLSSSPAHLYRVLGCETQSPSARHHSQHPSLYNQRADFVPSLPSSSLSKPPLAIPKVHPLCSVHLPTSLKVAAQVYPPPPTALLLADNLLPCLQEPVPAPALSHKVHLLRCHSMHCSAASPQSLPLPQTLCPPRAAPPQLLPPPPQFSQPSAHPSVAPHNPVALQPASRIP